MRNEKETKRRFFPFLCFKFIVKYNEVVDDVEDFVIKPQHQNID